MGEPVLKAMFGAWRDSPPPPPKIWKKVTYGGDKRDNAALLAMLARNRVVMDDSARQCVAEAPIAQVRVTVDLVLRKCREIGFTKPATFDEIEGRMKQSPNLGPCPAQAAIQLRCEWLDQKPRDDVWVFMEPTTTGTHPRIFCMSRDDNGLHLATKPVFCCHMRHTWHPDATLVFAVKQPST